MQMTTVAVGMACLAGADSGRGDVDWEGDKSVEWELQLLPNIEEDHTSQPVIGVLYLLIHSAVTLTHN